MSNTARSLLFFKPEGRLEGISHALRQNGWQVHSAQDATQANTLLRTHGCCVGLMHCDAADTRALLQHADAVLDQHSRVNWIALIGGTEPPQRRLLRTIADHFYDYHTLPLDTARLLATLGHAQGMAELAWRVANDAAGTRASGRFGMVGTSAAMNALYQRLDKVCSSDLNVMIRGESGTGKELAAQAIHRHSQRAQAPFVAVNCGALPKDLIQAELFGHEKGSFTGADRRRVGRIESAQGGTLFLDEIGDLPLELQVNLLRFLQEKTIDRVGGAQQIEVDVRVIAATHVNLEKAVEAGAFREDLYYRLNVLHLDMPPLRERTGDIERLANHFLQSFAAAMKPQLRGYSRAAITALTDYAWPGNVREMVNRVQRAVVMCEGRLLGPRDLGLDQDAPHPTLLTLAEARARAEKAAIEATLGAMRNNVSRSARRLGISRVTLYRLMELHGVEWQRQVE